MSAQPEAVRLFVGGHAGTIQGEREDLAGYRCFTAAQKPERTGFDPADVIALLDSGAFSDPLDRRLTPGGALARQLAWEERASARWGGPFRAHALVSYDLLIDETWTDEGRQKRRWSLGEAEWAVHQTIEAAHYLASQRTRLWPRRLVLSCQGVDPLQYLACAEAILQVATPDDWVGLGGWCIIGRHKRLLPALWTTLRLVLPRVAAAGVGHVHLFGVLWQPALGGLVWLADQLGLTVSSDSTAPVLACTWKNQRKSGARCAYWRDNVAWWQRTLANLRASEWYREPPAVTPARQLALV